MCHSSGVGTGERVQERLRRRRAVPSSARAIVRRELTWLAIVGSSAWILESPVLWPWAESGLAAACLWALTACPLLLLATQLRGGRTSRETARVATVAVCAVATVVLSWSVATAESWEAGASLAILTAGLAGALLPIRPALAVVGLVMVAALEFTGRVGIETGPLGVPTPFVAGYALALGVGMAVLRLALERNAGRIDEDVARREEAERQRGTVSGVEETLRRQERLLHETVLNTLTAISRGGLGASAEAGGALHSRCREAIDVLRQLHDGARALAPAAVVTPTGFVAIGDDLATAIEDARADGLRVDVVTDSLEAVPDRVRGALASAIRESLANTLRHAQASSASVLIRVTDEAGAVQVRAEVRDDGIGFDPGATRSRFGLTRAVHGPMDEIGGSATIQSRPGAGTRVILQWRSRTRDALDRGPWRSFALSPAATVAAFIAGMTALAWIEFNHPVAVLPDIALIAVLAVLIALATPEAPLPWSLVVTVAALGPLLALLGATSTGTPFVGEGWALAAVASLYMVVAAIGPPWAWVLLLASWMIGEGELHAVFADVVVLVIVGGAVFGRALRRDFAQMEGTRQRRLAAETALDVTREGVARLRSRYEALSDSYASDILEGILTGALDPEDDDVRRRAGIEESFIRTLIRIDPEADDLRRLAAELSRSAHRRGVPVSIELALPVVPSVVVAPPVAGSLAAAMAHASVGTPARFTARLADDSVVTTLVVTIDDGEVDRMRALPVPGELADPTDPADRTMLWEARLALGEAS